ncbi:hypothetical protein [Cytobacillus sp. IB215316]|uniref:hypothetical protein n=1 Tax=Cytobacillus sp. IB215316 TaxID=3097354 RepID=UPI002A119ADA|nr:hypothetical protein [Cytobacillus sp. IB215316]MDX8363018.1 hypothetical protein [Cytobacillus sp. IB215316]
MSALIALGVGALLIVLFPIINKESKVFAKISFITGILIILILIFILISPRIVITYNESNPNKMKIERRILDEINEK